MNRQHPLLIFGGIVAIVTGYILVVFSRIKGIPWIWNLNDRGIVHLGVIVLFGIWLINILLLFIFKKKIDWLSPRIFFGGIFLLSSLGQPILYYLVRNSSQIIYINISVTPMYIVAVSLGFIGFFISTFIVDRLIGYRWKELKLQQKIISELNTMQLSKLENLGIIIMMLSIVSLSFSSIVNIQAGVSYGINQYESGLSYYIYLIAVLLFPPALVMTTYSSVKSKRRVLPIVVIVLLGLYILINAFTGDRGVVLTALVAFALSWNYFYQRFRFYHILLSSILFIAFSFVVFTWRDSSGPLFDTLRSISIVNTTREAIEIIFRDVGAPAFITTHLLDWYPREFNFYNGRTYIDAVLSLIPSFFYGDRYARPFISPTYEFKMIYEKGRFNPNIGYGYSLIGEAYINFGYIGIFVIMFFVGLLLQYLYRTSTISRNWWVLPLFVIVYSVFPFNLRSDAISLVKSTFYGVIVLFISTFWVRTHIVFRSNYFYSNSHKIRKSSGNDF